MSFFLQIDDPEGLCVTLQLPGKYNPDELDDGKRRVVDMYRDALQTRIDMSAAVAVPPNDEGGEIAR